MRKTHTLMPRETAQVNEAAFEIVAPLAQQLSWSHFIALLPLDSDAAFMRYTRLNFGLRTLPSRRDGSLGRKNASPASASRRDASIGNTHFALPKEASLRDAGRVFAPFSTERNIPTGCLAGSFGVKLMRMGRSPTLFRPALSGQETPVKSIASFAEPLRPLRLNPLAWEGV